MLTTLPGCSHKIKEEKKKRWKNLNSGIFWCQSVYLQRKITEYPLFKQNKQQQASSFFKNPSLFLQSVLCLKEAHSVSLLASSQSSTHTASLTVKLFSDPQKYALASYLLTHRYRCVYHMHCFVHFNLNIVVIISMYTKGNLSSCLGKLLFITCYADLCLSKSVLPCQAPIKKKHLTAPSNSLNKTRINRFFCAWKKKLTP